MGGANLNKVRSGVPSALFVELKRRQKVWQHTTAYMRLVQHLGKSEVLCVSGLESLGMLGSVTTAMSDHILG